VGKKQTARALASFLFDSPDAMRIFEGSEYTESHSVAKLIGTSPGYIGHEQGGQLVEALYRRPFQVLLFHNFHMAHPEVQDLIARVLRSGTLVDGKGRTVWFSNCVIIVTVDLDPKVFDSRASRGVGFSAQKAAATLDDGQLWEAAGNAVPQVLRSAVDEALIFAPLSQDETLAVARLLVDESAKRLADEQDIHVTVTDEALQHLVDQGGYSPSKGAHPMRSVLQAELENRLAEQILDGSIRRGHRVTVTTGPDGLEFQTRRPVSIRAD
jgi:ATP-dependent Clp protease ATP-binding subunit ClpA